MFRVLMDEMPAMLAVVSCDVQARVLFANNAFAHFLHVGPQALVGR